ncbi:hypothetical protein THIX_30239 [Thiomonas sp. X19]|nr:hypothetical protein THIX_30239 [Thiomonas sp. X19]
MISNLLNANWYERIAAAQLGENQRPCYQHLTITSGVKMIGSLDVRMNRLWGGSGRCLFPWERPSWSPRKA